MFWSQRLAKSGFETGVGPSAPKQGAGAKTRVESSNKEARANSSTSAMRSLYYPFLEERAILGVIDAAVVGAGAKTRLESRIKEVYATLCLQVRTVHQRQQRRRVVRPQPAAGVAGCTAIHISQCYAVCGFSNKQRKILEMWLILIKLCQLMGAPLWSVSCSHQTYQIILY